jgi:cytochrome c oxidase subunit IV
MTTRVAPVRLYLGIFSILLVLTALTIGVSFVDLDRLNIVIALTIAVCKALLVILFFMHVRHASRLTWLFVSAGFFWLAILLVFTFGDYLSRPWESVSGW